jgi:hypothetical protein
MARSFENPESHSANRTGKPQHSTPTRPPPAPARIGSRSRATLNPPASRIWIRGHLAPVLAYGVAKLLFMLNWWHPQGFEPHPLFG